MNSIDEMNELIEKLNYYTKLYDEGHPTISDKEWDDMYFRLEELEKETGIVLANSPTAKIDYQVVNKLNKVTHNHPMLSLDKTKNIDDVLVFLNKKDGIAMAKMDGLTCSIRYLDGKLVSAETRGNGIVGEDITHNIKFVKDVPLEIPIKKEFIVDGEVICNYEDFEDFSTDYKNPRNFASGSIRLLDSRTSAQRKLSFVAWDCIKGLDDCKTLSEKLVELGNLGFMFVPYIVLPANMTTNTEHIEYAISLIKKNAQDYFDPIDGIVFKYDDCAYYQSLGYTGHHFRGGLAFKFYDEEYETNLRNIEWSMGKTGALTPVAIFDPVDDGESIVERASLYNLNIMKQILGYPYAAQPIKIIKANQIIPQVIWGKKIESNPYGYWGPPTKCPICSGNTFIKDDFLYCSNPNCEGKFINKLEHFCGKKGLDIKGLSEATLQKLVDWGWVGNYQELFSLANFRDEWIQKPGFGEKSVDNILAAIENARNCELWQFISALSIPLIGTTYAKEIAKREAGWTQFIEDVSPHMLSDGFDFTSWNGFGYEMNNSLHNFDYTEANELAFRVLKIYNSLWKNEKENIDKNDSIAGKIFVITGAVHITKNRDELKSMIEKAGGKVTNSVTKNTNYLITNDTSSGTTKNKRAVELGIPIITEEQLIAML